MSLSIAATYMSNRNEKGIPGEVSLVFTNGEKVTYTRYDKDTLNTKSKLVSFTMPDYEFKEEKFDEQTIDFDSLQSNFANKLRLLDEKYKSSVKEAEELYFSEKAEIEKVAKLRIDEYDQL